MALLPNPSDIRKEIFKNDDAKRIVIKLRTKTSILKTIVPRRIASPAKSFPKGKVTLGFSFLLSTYGIIEPISSLIPTTMITTFRQRTKTKTFFQSMCFNSMGEAVTGLS